MKYYDIYITFTFLIKIIFIILALTHIFLKISGKGKNTIDEKIKYWKERAEFVFVILMALLLIYIFNPTANRTAIIGRETKTLLFLFGFVLIITANWYDFIHESKFLLFLQKSVGQVGSR